MKLASILSPGRVAVADAPGDKWSAIGVGLKLLEGDPRIGDYNALVRAFWEREKVLPTGLGLGLGAPHVRHPAVRDAVGALVTLRAGVDYGSLDGQPVRAILTAAMPADSQGDWLLYLAALSTHFRDPAFREGLLACADAEALWDFVRDR